jgi:hypothetical protein
MLLYGRRRRKKNKLYLFLKEKYLEEYMVLNMKRGMENKEESRTRRVE